MAQQRERGQRQRPGLVFSTRGDEPVVRRSSARYPAALGRGRELWQAQRVQAWWECAQGQAGSRNRAQTSSLSFPIRRAARGKSQWTVPAARRQGRGVAPPPSPQQAALHLHWLG